MFQISVQVTLLCLLVTSISTQEGIANDNDDLVITWEQKLKLDQLSQIMEPHLPHEYMKKEVYLLQWLKARSFDLPAAIRMLKENLVWRRENDMDTILEEDWTQFNNEYRFNIDGCYDNGTPVGVLFVGEWNMRKAVIAGQSDKMRRYIDKCFEEVAIILRNMQESGSNVTKASLILDAASLSFQSQACPRCIPVYIYLVQSLGAHYPNLVNLIIVINTPDVAVSLWTNIIKPLAPPHVQKIVDAYGRKREIWRDALQIKYGIDWRKLSHELGGDGPDPVDSNELRDRGYVYQCPKED